MLNFDIFLYFLLLVFVDLLLKAHFNLVPADILKNHGMHSVPFIKGSELPGFSLQINVSSTVNMQRKGSIKSLPCSGLLLTFYELM